MKKLILSAAILSAFGVTANAMAAPNTGTVNFTGAVTSATCELTLQDSAGSQIQNVNLGVLSSTANADGSAVAFKLVPTDTTCLSKTAAAMSWTSPTLGSVGLSNATSNGTNAYMILSATNASDTDKAVKQGNVTFNYTATGGIKSFDYSAQLKKPATGTLSPGVFNASASYTVAYK